MATIRNSRGSAYSRNTRRKEATALSSRPSPESTTPIMIHKIPAATTIGLDLRRLVASSLMTSAYAAAKTAGEANPTQAPARSGLSPEAATAGCGAINAAPAIDPRFRPPPFRHPQAVGRVEAFAGAEKPSTPAPTTPDSTEPTSTPSRITVSSSDSPKASVPMNKLIVKPIPVRILVP